MKNTKLRKLINSSLMAALVVVGTMVIRIPTPTKGYIHIGDSIVYLCGILLGPLYGAVAAGLGSLLADVLAGYVVYAPATLVIKFIDAMIAGLIYLQLTKNDASGGKKLAAFSLAVFGGGLIMVSGYLAFETFLYGFPTAVLSVVPNIVQAVGGGVLLAPVLFVLDRQKVLDKE
jgi:uncharacterized membrane protein